MNQCACIFIFVLGTGAIYAEDSKKAELLELHIPFSVSKGDYADIGRRDIASKRNVSVYVDVTNDTDETVFFPLTPGSVSHMTLITQVGHDGQHYLSRSGGGTKRAQSSVSQPLFALIAPGKIHRQIVYEDRDIWQVPAMKIELKLATAFYHAGNAEPVNVNAVTEVVVCYEQAQASEQGGQGDAASRRPLP